MVCAVARWMLSSEVVELFLGAEIASVGRTFAQRCPPDDVSFLYRHSPTPTGETSSLPRASRTEDAAEISPPSRTIHISEEHLAGVSAHISSFWTRDLHNACQPRLIVSYMQQTLCGVASQVSRDSLWLLWLVHGLPDIRLWRKADQFA